MAFRLGMTVDLCMAHNSAHAHFDDLTLMQGYSGLAEEKYDLALNYLDN